MNGEEKWIGRGGWDSWIEGRREFCPSWGHPCLHTESGIARHIEQHDEKIEIRDQFSCYINFPGCTSANSTVSWNGTAVRTVTCFSFIHWPLSPARSCPSHNLMPHPLHVLRLSSIRARLSKHPDNFGVNWFSKIPFFALEVNFENFFLDRYKAVGKFHSFWAVPLSGERTWIPVDRMSVWSQSAQGLSRVNRKSKPFLRDANREAYGPQKKRNGNYIKTKTICFLNKNTENFIISFLTFFYLAIKVKKITPLWWKKLI